MRLIKPNDYNGIEMKIAYLGDALSHPVRKRILEHILESNNRTRTDFSRLLNLSKPAIAQHIQKLADADLVRFNYSLHYEEIELVPESFEILLEFLLRMRGDNITESPLKRK